MLKYDHLIRQLTDHDKIRILSDIHSLSDKKYRAIGIPEIRIGMLEAYCEGEYPTPIMLANSWNPTLVGEVADSISERMVADGVDLATVMGPKMKINPYRASFSEDPFLAGAMSSVYLRALKKKGISTCLDSYEITSDETEWLDAKPDLRWLHESVIRPYREVTEQNEVAAVMTSSGIDGQSEARRSVNQIMLQSLSEGTAIAVCREVDAENTVTHLIRGGLMFKGSAVTLKSALTRYGQLNKARANGNATTEELETEIAKGQAISPEILNAAVDRLLELVHTVKRKPSVTETVQDEALSLRAVRESTVLLKNEGAVLPMKQGARVSVIGDLAMIDRERARSIVDELSPRLTAQGYTWAGAERGYDIKKERSEELIDSAVALANDSDIVLLFLGYDAEGERGIVSRKKLSIPANQQHLLERLKENRHKVVAILSSEYALDVGLDDHCAAILISPMRTARSVEALSDILSGAFSPCGRLTSTVYTDSENRYVEYKTHRIRDGIQTGPFIGYRYYDTAGFCPGFAFGHGLGYTKFTYSQLSLTETSVRFTVKNTGGVFGTEVAQVYVGKQASDVLRPKKELVAFERIELAPGEKKTVELPIRLPSVYDVGQGRSLCESGYYEVFVGSSVSDIRLSGRISGGDTKLASAREPISRYIQSESNILTDHYKLEARCDSMKKSIMNYIFGAVALVLAISLKLYCVFTDTTALFFDVFSVILGVAGIFFFILEAIRRNRIYSEEKAALDRKNDESFASAEQIPVYQAGSMFAREFDRNAEETVNGTEEQAEVIDSEYWMYIDQEQSFASAARDFVLFAAENGYKIGEETAHKLFASLATSRLLLVNAMEEESFQSLVMLLSRYFETSVYLDAVNASYADAASLLFCSDSQGNRVKTNTLKAIEAARNTPQGIHFAALTGVCFADMLNYFSSYIPYVKNPAGHAHVTVMNENNVETTYFLPQNLWFVLNLSDRESVDMIPSFIAEVATVNTVAFEKCQAVAHHDDFRKFSYYQMDYLLEKACSKQEIEEETWKKIDRLEEYVNAHTPYHIGNRMWRGLEYYMFTYLACEGDPYDALDEAICATLLPSMLSDLKGKLSKDDKSPEEALEGIFGEDRTDACRKLIKTCGKYPS